MSLLGEVKVEFSSILDWSNIDIQLMNQTGFFFKVFGNKEYHEKDDDIGDIEPRNLEILNATLDRYGFNYMIFKLNFSRVQDISEGGVGYEDIIFADVVKPEIFLFENQTVPIGGSKEEKVAP